MVRSSNLKRLALLAFLTGLAAPAAAEAPLDWYIDLKREAKYARIASDRGASVQDLRPFDDAATRLVSRIDNWDAKRAREGSHRLCLMAAQNFKAALQKATSQARHAAIIEGEPRRDACLTAIQGR